MQNLYQRLKKDPYFKLESIKDTFPYSYENLLKDLQSNFSIYQCSLDSINVLNLFVFNKAGTIELNDITDLFDQ